MYTAPPGPDDENRRTPAESGETDANTAESADETESVAEETASEAPTPDLDPATGASDANWTGTLPADD